MNTNHLLFLCTLYQIQTHPLCTANRVERAGMNFTRFPASTTNIFPIANSKTGGQLMTEFNLRSRESVATHDEVEYFIGPSYTHSLDDFTVRILTDELGVAISSTTLEITPGRALVNGHYIESLSNVTVDLAEANRELLSEGYSELKGRLAIGLRAMYSTEQTLAASMVVENNQHLMAGIQIVILPIEYLNGEPRAAQGLFVLPEDSPDSDELESCHLKLAEFYYINGQIRSIEQNEKKIEVLDANRIGDFEHLLDEHYLSKDGLNPKKIYTLAGKSEDGQKISGKPTWCDSTDSIFVWQKAAKLTTTLKDPDLDQAEFGIMYSDGTLINQTVQDETKAKDDTIVLHIPHKAMDGGMWNAAGQEEWYKPRIMHLPQADYATGTPGTVSKSYTNSIKAIREAINNFYHLPAGHLRRYIEELAADRKDAEGNDQLPPINRAYWRAGDYVLVGKDNSVVSNSTNLVQAPSTIYVMLPPIVSRVKLRSTTPSYVDEVPIGLDGVEVNRVVIQYPGTQYDTEEDIQNALSTYLDVDNDEVYNNDLGIYVNSYDNVDSKIRGSYRQLSKENVYATGVDDSATQTPIDILIEGFEGSDAYYDFQDYVTLEVQEVPYQLEDGTWKYRTHYYYYVVTDTVSGSETYSDPILLTGTIPLATESMIGGFINVSDTDLDNGYVYRDSDGHLRLLDYALLRSGVLAYQLGQDYSFGPDMSTADIQTQLDEYVNDRVAFPTEEQLNEAILAGRNPNMIEIVLELPQEEAYSTINVENIDSRWGTFVHLIITGSADSYTTVNVRNCEKIKITIGSTTSQLDVEAGYGPVVNIENCNLFYDPTVIDYVHRCPRSYGDLTDVSTTGETLYEDGYRGIENMTIWFERLEDADPKIIVDGMTITEVESPIIPDDVDFWSVQVINDNHYYFGLQSITLNPQGDMVGCGLYMRNDMSANIEFGKTIAISPFTLPQGSGFAYPETAVTKQIKINGCFVTAYSAHDPKGYITMETKFTALTQRYISDASEGGSERGTISFLSESSFIDDFIAVDGLENGSPIDGWEANSYHVFRGWTIG